MFDYFKNICYNITVAVKYDKKDPPNGVCSVILYESGVGQWIIR